MNNIIKILTNPLLISIIGLIALSVVIWFGGPLIAISDSKPLESDFSRLLAILVITLIWGLNNFRVQNKQKKKDADMLGDIAQSQTDKSSAQDSRSLEESKVLQQHFQEAQAILKSSKKHGTNEGNTPIHELPWYIIIGPPGSGKTTALINSGLRFPLAEKMGQQPLKGVGGTRNCDWWFSDEAILIDTAGRYTTQDSDQASDSAGWTSFLNLLRKHRPKQPINGVILSISLSELMLQPETERRQHANNIKLRLQELYENLGIQFPVYVLFTKCDLIAGFNEYFDNLTRQERQQIWGMTFPGAENFESHFDLSTFKEEYDALLRRLNDRLQWRMQEERDLSRRALILGFPAELAALKEMTTQFLDTTFKPSNFDKTVNLRGVYFTSGTQEGTPIDRVMGALAHNFGLDRQNVPAYSGQGKSFFLTQLFRNVIFPEAMLAGSNRLYEQKQSLLRKGAYVLALVTTIAAVGLWTSNYTEINSQIATLDQHVNEYAQEHALISANGTDPAELLAPLMALQQAQSSANDSRSFFSQSGLSQMSSLGPASDDAYHRTLQLQFFPRLVNLLTDVLNSNEATLDEIFFTLKTYLMLADPERFDDEQVTQWFRQTWENQFPGNTEQQTQLQQHLKTLFHIGFTPITLDESLVRTARQELKKIPLAKRIYSSLKQKAENTLPTFFLSSILDTEEQQIYLNKRDVEEPLKGIPGLFTKEGYDALFMEESIKMTKATSKDDWIFGKSDDNKKEKIDTKALHKDVESLYISDFEKHWNGLFNNIKISKFKHFEQSVDMLENLAGSKSSMMRVLETININTDLRNKPNLLQKAGAKNLKKLGKVGKKAAKKVKSDIPLTPVGKELRKRFSKLIALTDSVKGNPPELQRHLKSLISLQDYLNEISVAADPQAAALQASITRMKTNGKDIIGKLRRDSKRIPKPVSQWFQSISASAWSIMLKASRQNLNTQWKNQIIAKYDQSIKNRYPIYKAGKQETSLRDFSDFFASDGEYQQFLNQKLRPFIRTGGRSWSLKVLDGQSIGISKRALRQIKRGETISNAFFPKGSENIGMKFRLKPSILDAKVKRFTLTMDGEKVTYRHGPTRSSSHSWPFTDDPESSKISLRFETSGNKIDKHYKGTWAFFKLLDSSRVKSSSSGDKFKVTFNIENYTAKYELKANSVINPFNLAELHAFRIPGKL